MTQTLTQPLTVPDAIASRRSIRKFVQEPLPEADLREIIRLAGLAPSAWNVQPWRFAVVQDPELKARLREAAYGQAGREVLGRAEAARLNAELAAMRAAKDRRVRAVLEHKYPAFREWLRNWWAGQVDAARGQVR